MKKSFWLPLFATTVFFLCSELWDILIYAFWPNQNSKEITNLAATIVRPFQPIDFITGLMMFVLGVVASSFGLIIILRYVGANDEFFERQHVGLWLLVGLCFSLNEFSEVLNDFFVGMIIFLLLLVLWFIVKPRSMQESI